MTQPKDTHPNQEHSQTVFEHSFSSEKLLQQAIASLLTRMPETSGVQILQGSQELGKDLIFFVPGGFEELILCACVVKNSRITGNVDKSSGARTVYFQAEQAFDSAHTTSLGRDLHVERVYVITPYTIPPSTISSIKGKLQRRAGQVVFIDGAMLFDLFKKYWPDYFADEVELIKAHINSTRETVTNHDDLRGLASQYSIASMEAYPKKVYVSQNLYREVRNYGLGPVLRNPLPRVEEIQKTLTKENIEWFQERLNALRRAITFLNEWGLCSDEDKESIYHLSGAVISGLTDTKRTDEEIESEGLLLTEVRALVRKTTRAQNETSVNENDKPVQPTSKKVKRLLERLRETELRFENLKANKLKEIKALIELMRNLDTQRESVVSFVRSNLDKLGKTIRSKKLMGIQALNDPAYLNACRLDDCINAAPPDMFISKESTRLNFPKELIDEWPGHLLIVGAPGFGKTSFCRWHALQDAERFSTGESNVVPVYVPLYQLSRGIIGSFRDTFLSNLGKSALLGDIREGTSLRLYLDGLDEIALPARRQEVVELARAGVSEEPGCQIILTCRNYVYARWLDWLPRVTIGGFEEPDIRELTDRWLSPGSESNRRFSEQLDKTASLKQLMQTPLLATLIIMVFRQTGKLPENRTRLYEIFVSLLSGGWDLAKGVLRESKFGERSKVLVLTTLARTLQEARRREFTSDDVRKAIGATLAGSLKDDWELLTEELVIDGLVTRGGDVLQLAHQSFQEFLTAKNFMGSPEPLKVNRALESYLGGDDWWKEVLHFYIGLTSNPTEMVTWLADRMRHIHTLSFVTMSGAQIEDLRLAVAESFPEYPISEINKLRYYIY